MCWRKLIFKRISWLEWWRRSDDKNMGKENDNGYKENKRTRRTWIMGGGGDSEFGEKGEESLVFCDNPGLPFVSYVIRHIILLYSALSRYLQLILQFPYCQWSIVYLLCLKSDCFTAVEVVPKWIRRRKTGDLLKCTSRLEDDWMKWRALVELG